MWKTSRATSTKTQRPRMSKGRPAASKPVERLPKRNTECASPGRTASKPTTRAGCVAKRVESKELDQEPESTSRRPSRYAARLVVAGQAPKKTRLTIAAGPESE